MLENPLLDHVWGISPGADRVWAQIAGVAPSTKPWKRLFMVLQAFIDDSYTPNGTFVLGGFIATAEAWAKFSTEWEPLLPLTNRGKSGKFRFKMNEMIKERPDRVAPFLKIIEKFVLASLYCKLNIADLQMAKERIWSERDIYWSVPSQPYWLCFSGLLGSFQKHRIKESKLADILPLNERVDFYFDRRSARDSNEIAAHWEDFASKETQSLYGTVPRFENDEEFLPLQAADYWAWWVRNIYENKNRSRKSSDIAFKPARSIPALAYAFTEDTLVNALIKKVRFDPCGPGPNIPIYDAKIHPRPESNTVKTLSSSLRTKIRRMREKPQS
jgi:Protein of unknown function (DUF3800)